MNIRTTVDKPIMACGHQYRGREIPATAAGIAFAAEIAEGSCDSCVKDQAQEQAQQAARELGFPDLIGSDKQVPFGVAMRDKIRQQLDGIGAEDQIVADALLYGITDAAWWIDHVYRKSDSAYALIEWLRPVVMVVASATPAVLQSSQVERIAA